MSENYNLIIAENLKALREKRNLSLDKTAKITGVSKSMIARIERGDVNPTVTLMWKLANGLQVSFIELMYRPKPEIEVIKKGSLKPLEDDYGRFRNYPVLPYNSDKRFEVYMVEIDPQGSHDTQPHPAGTEEFLTVSKGSITLTINNKKHKLSAGDSIRFKADLSHSYLNTGKKACRLNLIISYPAL